MLPDDLRTALDQALARHSPQELARSVARLTERYRGGASADAVRLLGPSGGPAHVGGPSGEAPHIRGQADVAAYAAYRMPATYEAAALAMRQAAARVPGFEPLSQLDAGGGTGAAIWAAGSVWPSLRQVTVVERDPHVIDLGRRLARAARAAGVRGTAWRQAAVAPGLDRPRADLATMSYALGELPERDRPDVVRWLARDAAMVIVVEPGTPAGYATVAAAREVLLAEGLSVVAPCPHDRACPIEPGRDWCHFSVRLPRTSLHRQVKAGTLSFEDEKFAYVAATARPAPRPAADRVLRHPQKRKGVVSLRLCTDTGGIRDELVSKRQGELYRRARDAGWGDAWGDAGGDAGGDGRPAAVAGEG
ncbi:Mitochondrial small ribosomal subunit Rsm22 [Nonomuraea coxensis DSM 45129]|uniref:Mitochondrial small ribosomal subunit Rsm22 n=1 Tax=Nonomuraea coxensis DSM 45129 TaxID=1122611 RepID=A0ABX8U4I1_9ACTN|nr:small ribosomal subunit Rsm22 family protein [Nonomuraea coxensis]QYC42647.1 Mitochondrial small ribosomal subunit Rsm22 [Nonomuraea coxensis DSM 45129]